LEGYVGGVYACKVVGTVSVGVLFGLKGVKGGRAGRVEGGPGMRGKGRGGEGVERSGRSLEEDANVFGRFSCRTT